MTKERVDKEVHMFDHSEAGNTSPIAIRHDSATIGFKPVNQKATVLPCDGNVHAR
jgi:hypothetical protein